MQLRDKGCVPRSVVFWDGISHHLFHDSVQELDVLFLSGHVQHPCYPEGKGRGTEDKGKGGRSVDALQIRSVEECGGIENKECGGTTNPTQCPT